MLNNLKEKYPDREYPKNLGKRWTPDEELSLMHELKNDIDVNEISDIHQRTIGGITSRIKLIAYNMYKKNININEILQNTKLEENELTEYINKKEQTINKKEQTINKNNVNINNKLNNIEIMIRQILMNTNKSQIINVYQQSTRDSQYRKISQCDKDNKHDVNDNNTSTDILKYKEYTFKYIHHSEKSFNDICDNLLDREYIIKRAFEHGHDSGKQYNVAYITSFGNVYYSDTHKVACYNSNTEVIDDRIIDKICDYSFKSTHYNKLHKEVSDLIELLK